MNVWGRALSVLALGVLAWIASVTVSSLAADRHMMAPRVPADQLEAARAMTNPLPDSPNIVKKGKALYEGKGTCVTCHGATGRGDGPGAAGLDPPPRNFLHHGFWRQRTEVEIFWVIQHGSHGTVMIGFVSILSEEEIWAIIQYERSFSGGHGRGGPMGRGMGRMGAHGPEGGEKASEGTCCNGESR